MEIEMKIMRDLKWKVRKCIWVCALILLIIHTAESSSGGDVTIEFMDQGVVTMAFENHLLITKLFGDIYGGEGGSRW